MAGPIIVLPPREKGPAGMLSQSPLQIIYCSGELPGAKMMLEWYSDDISDPECPPKDGLIFAHGVTWKAEKFKYAADEHWSTWIPADDKYSNIPSKTKHRCKKQQAITSRVGQIFVKIKSWLLNETSTHKNDS